MTAERVIWVNIGEVKTTSSGQTLKTNLGSCVGIGLLWRERHLYGLAHCLLPAAPPEQTVKNGKYVDHAVALLVEKMKITRADTADVEAIVGGGAAIIKVQSGTKQATKHWTIGDDNVAAALQQLTKLHVPLMFRDVGDHYGRQMTLDGKEGTYFSQRIDTHHGAER
jgi:chemotaxis protein CheD